MERMSLHSMGAVPTAFAKALIIAVGCMFVSNCGTTADDQESRSSASPRSVQPATESREAKVATEVQLFIEFLRNDSVKGQNVGTIKANFAQPIPVSQMEASDASTSAHLCPFDVFEGSVFVLFPKGLDGEPKWWTYVQVRGFHDVEDFVNALSASDGEKDGIEVIGTWWN